MATCCDLVKATGGCLPLDQAFCKQNEREKVSEKDNKTDKEEQDRTQQSQDKDKSLVK